MARMGYSGLPMFMRFSTVFNAAPKIPCPLENYFCGKTFLATL